MDRQKLLKILYNTLPDKTKIQLNKTVSRIDHRLGPKSSVQVHTADGGVYEGDLVVGADGVHSRARAEMWRMASSRPQNEISEGERNGTSVSNK